MGDGQAFDFVPDVADQIRVAGQGGQLERLFGLGKKRTGIIEKRKKGKKDRHYLLEHGRKKTHVRVGYSLQHSVFPTGLDGLPRGGSNHAVAWFGWAPHRKIFGKSH